MYVLFFEPRQRYYLKKDDKPKASESQDPIKQDGMQAVKKHIRGGVDDQVNHGYFRKGVSTINFSITPRNGHIKF